MNDLATIAVLGGSGGLVAAGWGYIKAAMTRITGLLIVRVTIRYGMNEAVETLIWKDFKRWRSSFPTYDATSWFVQPLEKYQRVGYETVGEAPLLFWKGWRPLIASYEKEENQLTIKFIRGTFEPDRLITEAIARYNKEMDGDEEGRFEVIRMQGKGRQNGTSVSISGGKAKPKKDEDDDVPRHHPGARSRVQVNVRLLGYERDQLGQPKEGRRAINRLALEPDVEQAVTEVRHWAKSGAWYRERQIPWRRGYLLHGLPGTGKSSLSVALAQDLGLPLYVFDIGSMSNKELTDAWKAAISNTPAVILIEDIDAVFHGRANVLGENGGGLSFDALLNTISGVENADGIFLIITTNNIEHIDPALGLPQAGSTVSTRPGRLDRTIKLNPPDAIGRRKIATRILGDAVDLDAIVEAGAGMTGAQFQEFVSMQALTLYWQTRDSQP